MKHCSLYHETNQGLCSEYGFALEVGHLRWCRDETLRVLDRVDACVRPLVHKYVSCEEHGVSFSRAVDMEVLEKRLVRKSHRFLRLLQIYTGLLQLTLDRIYNDANLAVVNTSLCEGLMSELPAYACALFYRISSEGFVQEVSSGTKKLSTTVRKLFIKDVVLRKCLPAVAGDE